MNILKNKKTKPFENRIHEIGERQYSKIRKETNMSIYDYSVKNRNGEDIMALQYCLRFCYTTKSSASHTSPPSSSSSPQQSPPPFAQGAEGRSLVWRLCGGRVVHAHDSEIRYGGERQSGTGAFG